VATMTRVMIGLAGLAGLLAVSAVRAQLLPAVPAAPLGAVVTGSLDRLAGDARQVTGDIADGLARLRLDRLTALVRGAPGRIELDPDGSPARAGEVVVDQPDDALIAAATARGYRVIERGQLIGVDYARLAVPPGRSLKGALRELRKLGGQVSADQIHFQSGAVPAPPGAAPKGDGPVVGMIDGGVAGDAPSRGFASGAPRASNHGSAVASLIGGGGGIRGGLPGARVMVADVYGDDPAGGNATAIAKALAWLVGERVGVVNISLVGPANPLLARVVAAAQARGTIIVAAVGNDGPAAPPGFPASYPGVIAVSGVDARDRALIEAGRASHLDYVAPGADMLARDAGGRGVRVRGTSFAAPLVAATFARFHPAPDPAGMRRAIALVDATARDLGKRGADPIYGRGLVCGDCRTAAK